ncbi:MAG: hypothetical protein KGL42_02185 [Betaproteobacteria bacterium]|nr:hypothetical protein [Betaproteobacteria bacterium]
MDRLVAGARARTALGVAGQVTFGGEHAHLRAVAGKAGDRRSHGVVGRMQGLRAGERAKRMAKLLREI